MALAFSLMNATIQLLVPLYALRLGSPGLTIGILAALPSVANMTLRLAVGQLSDRYGETKILQIGGLVNLAATIGLLLSTVFGLPALAGAQLVQGIGRAIFWTVGQTYVTKLPLRSGQHLSFFNGATNLGMLLGMGGAGLWVATLGYRGAFTIGILLALLYAALTTFLRPLPQPPRKDHPPRPQGRLAAFSFRLGPLWLAACCSFVGAATWAMSASFYPVYLARLHYGEKSIGLLVMLLSAGMLCISFVSRVVVGDGPHLRRLALVFIAGTGLGLATVPAFQSWLPLAGLFLATGFCSGGCNLLYQLMVQQYSAWNARGATMAAVGLFGNLALLVLPTTIGVALSWISLGAALVGAGLFLTLLGAIAGLGVKGIERTAVSPAHPERDAART